MYDIDVGCILKSSTGSIKVWWDQFHTYIIYDFSQLSQIWGYLCGGNGMSVLPYAHPQLFKVSKHLIYVRHRCGMQFEGFYSLNNSVLGSFPHLHHLGFQLSKFWGNLCGGNGMSVLPYAHPQLFKVFKHLIYVWHRSGMQFERFYSLFDGKKVKTSPWGIDRCCVMSVSQLMYGARGRWWSWWCRQILRLLLRYSGSRLVCNMVIQR